ncbi:Hypothetical protein, putative [Bodo saltans]|uniref:Uncharacterized protein n=1 Tax=Bodo saltans TaxID=75058 RepID=A0A0S4INA3_BODSA|nr:Hypothetical protein, putative [Bodo saltans]|eukprot:CUE78991.1 Hypothetical protein, putative [Bodo saltans]
MRSNGTRKVLRAETSPESASGFIISAFDVCDAGCGPNEPMPLESEHLYATLAQQLARAAAVDLSTLFAPKPVVLGEVSDTFQSTTRLRSRRSRPARFNESMTSIEHDPLTVTSTMSSSLSRLRGVSPPHHSTLASLTHPTSHSGRDLVALGSESYRQRQALVRFIEEAKQLAAEAKQTLGLEFQQRLSEQTQNWQRYVAQLNDEIHRMQITIRDQQIQLSKAALTAPRATASSSSYQLGRSCGGPMPPLSDRATAVSSRKPSHGLQRDGAAPRDEGAYKASDELLPQRVTEALLHILQKQPVLPRKSGGSSPRR